MFNELLNEHLNLDKIQIKDKLIQGGGGSSIITYINLIIGLMLMVIGIILLFNNKFWDSTLAEIIKINEVSNEKNLLIKYQINDVYFRKIISLNTKKIYKVGDKMIIFYEKTNPNIIKLNIYGNKWVGVLLIIISMFFIVKNF
jgi:hypothetical protein